MATAGAMQEPPGMLCLKLAVGGIHAIDMVELDRDAGRHETVSRVFGKGRGPGVVPPKLRQVDHATCLRYGTSGRKLFVSEGDDGIDGSCSTCWYQCGQHGDGTQE